MKKFGFLALIAAALMVSCGPTTKDPVVTSIKLNENQVTLALGGDIKLQANVVCDPADAKVAVEWSTDNAEVATVKNTGLVQAVGEGECTITAKAGDKTATCKVTVAADAAYDNFEIADYGVFGLTPMEGAETVGFRLNNGDSVLCELQSGFIYAWDSGVNFVSGEGLVGDGIVCEFEVPLYVIKENLTTAGYGIGYYLGEGGCYVYNTKEVIPAVGKPGHIDPETYGDFILAQYTADVEADFETMQEKTNGALVAFCNAEEGYDGNYALYSGAVNRLIIWDGEEEGDPLTYAADITWCNFTSDDRLYGFAVDMDVLEAEKKLAFITPYDYATVHKVYDPFEIFNDFEERNADILATKAKKIGTHYMGAEKPLVNGKPLDVTKLHMGR